MSLKQYGLAGSSQIITQQSRSQIVTAEADEFQASKTAIPFGCDRNHR